MKSRKDYNSTYYQKHKEEIISQNTDYYINNTEACKKRKAAWGKKNKEHIAEKSRLRYLRVKDSFKTDPRKYYSQYKANAKKKGKEWGIDIETFKTFWQKPCSYCGDEIQTVGIDRVDNSVGYIAENLASCCGTCNYFKRALTEEHFIKHCKKIIKHYESNI